MASQASTPSRRVLGALDSNTSLPSPSPLLSPSKKPVGSSMLSPTRMSSPRKLAASFITEAAPASPGLKRKIGVIYKDVVEGDEKRVRIVGGAMEGGDASRGSGDSVMEIESVQDSPSSTRESVFDTTNDSNNTTMTEVDDELLAAGQAQLPPALPLLIEASRPILISAQARTTAQTLRLRLRLAQYKIATNQVSVPLEHLSIIPRLPNLSRKSSFADYTPSRHQRTQSYGVGNIAQANMARKRTPLPAAKGSHDGSSESGAGRPRSADAVLEAGHDDRDARYCHSPETVRGLEQKSSPAKVMEGFATPMLPRSRDFDAGDSAGLWTPDLTSSVVKGRAADGLLKLMMGGMA